MIRSGRFIAVIDSDADVRRAMGRLLRAHGFRPQGFASAEAFLARGRADDPACLVLDLALGGMSGLDLLDRLKADGLSAARCNRGRLRRLSAEAFFCRGVARRHRKSHAADVLKRRAF